MQPPILTLDENTLKDEIRDLVRGTVEEALMGTCLLGVSTRNVEDVTRALWDEGLSAGTAPNPDQEASEKVDAWRRPLASERPYVYVDGTYVRRNWGGAHEGVAVLVAVGADPDGRREAVGVEEGHGESEDSWREFLLGPGDRGLAGAGPAAGDKSAGMLGTLSEVFPSAERQRCTVRSCRNVLAKVPKRRRKAVAAPRRHAPRSRWRRPPGRRRRWPGRRGPWGSPTPRGSSKRGTWRRPPTRASLPSTGGESAPTTGSSA